jgi:hypothetical protein
MIDDLEENYYSHLEHFYNKLSKKILSKRVKLIKGSIFLTLIKMTKTRVSELLSESALPDSAFRQSDLKSLILQEYIYESEDIDKKHQYIITALGLWTIEARMKKLEISQLINFFQETKFGSEVSEKPLTDMEKIILTSLIALRNFSPKVPMDLNDKIKREYWIEIFDRSAKYLKYNKLISKEKWGPTNTGNEHSINYVMRRANDLPQKTKHLYRIEGNNTYYLDLLDTAEKSKGKLEFLFSIIFDQVESREELRDILSFLSQLAYDRGKNVRESFEYIDQEWDSIIRDALDDFYYNQEIN